MEKKNLNLGEVHMFGIEQGTYDQLSEIAQKEGKGTNEVASEALRAHIEKKRQLKESTQKRILTEG